MHRRSIVLLILLAIFSSSSCNNNNLLSNEIRPCLSRSLDRVFLDHNQHEFDCTSLSTNIQTILALHFTFCHLNSTGIDSTTICSSLDSDINDCLKNITRNPFAYLTYTNFVPHVQSICYAIETQRWHMQTRDTVAQLDSHSARVESESKKLLEEQENMQVNLQQALTINQHSVDDALNIDRLLQVAQTDVDELRGQLYVKDKVQIELIQQILDTLFNVQSSLFADAFGWSSYVFYAASLIGIYLMTMPDRTSDARFWLILLWLCLIGLERYMLFFPSHSQIVLYDILWRFRQLWLLISCLTWAFHAVHYRNFHKENQKIIDEIDRKHEQLEMTARRCLTVINQLQNINDSLSDDLFDGSSASNDTSMSSDDADERKNIQFR